MGAKKAAEVETAPAFNDSFIDGLRTGRYNKALFAAIAAAAAILKLAGVEFDTDAARVVVGLLLAAVGPAVYLVRNLHDYNPPKANKALAALGATVVGVAMVFHVDVSEPVQNIVAAAGSVLPLVVGYLSNN